MSIDALISGYVSMDRIIDVADSPKFGFTSLIANADNSDVYPGGCSINIAAALNALGLNAVPWVRVGDDELGTTLRHFLNRSRVSAEAVSTVPGARTSNTYLIEDPAGEHITLFYPGAMNGQHAAPVPAGLAEQARIGVITVASEPDNRAFLSACKTAGIPVAFGMKGDFAAFPRDVLWELLTYCSIIFVNRAERAAIERVFDLEQITELFTQGRADYIVMTAGSEGSTVYERVGAEVHASPVRPGKCQEVVDATGSGDAYIAGFLFGLLRGYSGQICGQLGSNMSSFILEARGCCSAIPTLNNYWNRYIETFGKDPRV